MNRLIAGPWIVLSATACVALAVPATAWAIPSYGTVIYSTSFDGAVGSEWGSMAGSFSGVDTNGDSVIDALQQTGGEGTTLVYKTTGDSGVPYGGGVVNDYLVTMYGRGTGVNADLGVAVRARSSAPSNPGEFIALTFQYINGNFTSLASGQGGSGGGGFVFGPGWGSATNFIPGFDVTKTHKYQVQAIGGEFKFWVDDVFIGSLLNPNVYKLFDANRTGTVGVAGWDPVIIEDFKVQYVPEPMTALLLLTGLSVLHRRRSA